MLTAPARQAPRLRRSVALTGVGLVIIVPLDGEGHRRFALQQVAGGKVEIMAPLLSV